jgi:hypothetical protein
MSVISLSRNSIQWSQKWPTYSYIPRIVLAKIYISTRPWERYSFHILARGCGRTSCELFWNGNNILFPISSPLQEVGPCDQCQDTIACWTLVTDVMSYHGLWTDPTECLRRADGLYHGTNLFYVVSWLVKRHKVWQQIMIFILGSFTKLWIKQQYH